MHFLGKLEDMVKHSFDGLDPFSSVGMWSCLRCRLDPPNPVVGQNSAARYKRPVIQHHP